MDRRTLTLLVAGTFITMSAPTISPALTGLQARFADEPHAEIMTRLLVPAPSLVVACLAPFVGMIADRCGKSAVLLWGGLIFALAGSAGLYLPSLKLILASRFVLGAGVAMVMTSQIALIGDCYAGARRSQVMEWQIAARNFGGMIYVALGGILAGIAPQLTFAVFGIAFLFLPLAFRAFHGEAAGSAAKDAGERGGAENETRADWIAPLAILSCVMLVTVAIFFQMPTQLPFFLETLGVQSASGTGTALTVLTFCGGVAAMTGSGVKRRLGALHVIAAGFGLMAAGFLVLSVVDRLMVVVCATALIGAAYALLMPAFPDLLMRFVPASRRGTASGVLTSSAFVGQFASPLVATPLITELGYRSNFLGGAVLLAVLAFGAALTGLVRGRKTRGLMQQTP